MWSWNRWRTYYGTTIAFYTSSVDRTKEWLTNRIDFKSAILMAYKGELTYSDLKGMPANTRHTYYIRAMEKLSTDAGRKEIQGKELEQQLQGVLK